MTLYERLLLPRLTTWVCGSALHERTRQLVVPRARGVVVELGAGSGLNLPLYDPAVERVFAVEPSVEMWGLALERQARAKVPVEHVPASALAVPLPDASADAVVVTWSLCTIPEPARALAEVRRLLRPKGLLFFAEHGLAPDADVQRWQRRLEPWWVPLAGGCHLTRDVPALLAGAGFLVEELEAGYTPGPRPFGFNVRGVAAPRRT